MYVNSTVFRFSVQGSDGTIPGPKLAHLLRYQLLKEKTDYLLFKVLRVDTVSKWHRTTHFFYILTKSPYTHHYLVIQTWMHSFPTVIYCGKSVQCACCSVLVTDSVTQLLEVVPVILCGWRTLLDTSLMMKATVVRNHWDVQIKCNDVSFMTRKKKRAINSSLILTYKSSVI